MTNRQNRVFGGVAHAPAISGADAIRLLFGAMLGLVYFSEAALAQSPDLAGMLQAELAVKGKGWAQLFNTEEMLLFVLGVVETTVMTAVIAYHPTSLAARKSAADFQMPRTLFAYSLIGMVVGFLVVNHGYVIGFVIFGLGGLLRIRNETERYSDTVKYILVTLLGLCVGIGLPVMALIITLSAWSIMHFLGRVSFLTLEVRFPEETPISQSIAAFQARLDRLGFKTVNMTKSKFKPSIEFVLADANKAMRDSLTREMTGMATTEPKIIVDWHLD